MKKIIARLESLKIAYSYNKNYFGCSYFEGFGVPSISFDVVSIVFSYSDSTLGLKKLEKYCKRYGYEFLRFVGFPGTAFYKICRSDDYKRLKTYQKYVDMSSDACNKTMHLRQVCGMYADETNAEFNERLRGIMEIYAGEYLAELKKADRRAA